MARKNYFETNIQKYGEDFLDYKRAEDIQKDSKFIFKDIVYGNINYEKYGTYFTDTRFIEQLIIKSEIEAKKHEIKLEALNQYIISNNKMDNHNPLPHDMLQLACDMQQSEYDLKMIMWTLNNYLWKVKFDNYNIQCLLELPAVLKQHRSSMKDM